MSEGLRQKSGDQLSGSDRNRQAKVRRRGFGLLSSVRISVPEWQDNGVVVETTTESDRGRGLRRFESHDSATAGNWRNFPSQALNGGEWRFTVLCLNDAEGSAVSVRVEMRASADEEDAREEMIADVSGSGGCHVEGKGFDGVISAPFDIDRPDPGNPYRDFTMAQRLLELSEYGFGRLKD